MKNTTMYPVYRKKKRPVDELVEKTYLLCGRGIVFIMTKKVKTWQGVFILSFVTGIAIATIWSVSFDLSFAQR
jgi:hypothetical protein